MPCKVVLFLKILENAVQFSPGSCRKCKSDFLVEWKAPKVTKQIEVIHSVLTESSITAWRSRNGNKNFLTWNSKFQSDQTDRKWTTLTTGSPTTYFVNFHTFSYKLEVRRTPTEFGQPVL